MSAIRPFWPTLGFCAGSLLAQPPATLELPALEAQVRATENAFAKTMADRDFAAFQRFLSEETVFGNRTILRGAKAVAEGWKRYYEGPRAPFSWKPDYVQVLASGTLAVTRGPVFDPEGKPMGRFNSVWRLEAPNTWRIVFDFGD